MCDTAVPYCNGTCTNHSGNAVCTCPRGYELQGNETCIGTVILILAFSRDSLSCLLLVPHCECDIGFLLHCFVADVDECVELTDPCGVIGTPECINTAGTYTCQCMGGLLQSDLRSCAGTGLVLTGGIVLFFTVAAKRGKHSFILTWLLCTTACPDGTWGEDCTKFCNCANDTCEALTGCLVCNPGWTGGQCDENIDECTAMPNICGDYATCNDTEGSFVCICDDGYELTLSGCNGKDRCR